MNGLPKKNCHHMQKVHKKPLLVSIVEYNSCKIRFCNGPIRTLFRCSEDKYSYGQIIFSSKGTGQAYMFLIGDNRLIKWPILSRHGKLRPFTDNLKSPAEQITTIWNSSVGITKSPFVYKTYHMNYIT